MKKKTVLIILLCAFVFGLFSSGLRFIKAFVNEYRNTDEAPVDEGYEEDYAYEEESDEEYNYQDSEVESMYMEDEEIYSPGDEIDIIDGNIPCIYGDAEDLYEKTEIDTYNPDEDDEENYYKSNYGTYFPKLLSCWSEGSDTEVSFLLEKKYSTLTFNIGLWDEENDGSVMVIVYKGNQSKKKRHH